LVELVWIAEKFNKMFRFSLLRLCVQHFLDCVILMLARFWRQGKLEKYTVLRDLS
jgi:hypothetical protein